MASRVLENLNIVALDVMPSPEEIHSRVPISARAAETVFEGRETLKRILDRKDHRLFIVVGPCSIHDVIAGLDYAHRLKRLAEQVRDTLFIVMRVYFEKPRTSIGWKGFINDPRMDDSFHIEEGMEQARRFLLQVNELGVISRSTRWPTSRTVRMNGSASVRKRVSKLTRVLPPGGWTTSSDAGRSMRRSARKTVTCVIGVAGSTSGVQVSGSPRQPPATPAT